MRTLAMQLPYMQPERQRSPSHLGPEAVVTRSQLIFGVSGLRDTFISLVSQPWSTRGSLPWATTIAPRREKPGTALLTH